jgi:hypothetical protein
VYFSPTAQPISKRPAKNSVIHAMRLPSPDGAAKKSGIVTFELGPPCPLPLRFLFIGNGQPKGAPTAKGRRMV